MADHLTDAPTNTGQRLAATYRLVRIDSHLYRWMGTLPRGYFGLPSP